jgi:hypothetical protein
MCSGEPLDYGCDRQPKWKLTHPSFSFYYNTAKGQRPLWNMAGSNYVRVGDLC